MRGDEIKETGALLGRELDDLTVLTRDVHRAVADRLFGLLGSAGVPVRALHHGIATIAYGSTRLGVRVVPPVVAAVRGELKDRAAESAHDLPKGRFALSALNGFRGDRLAVQHPPIAPLMRIRTHAGRLRRAMANVAHDAGTDVTGKLIVFVHGLCENDLYWHIGAKRNWGDPTVTFGAKLREDDGWTPLYVHYNTGLHVSANGAELAERIEQLTSVWPVPVTDIALVGHSMGGLIVRSAAHQADEKGMAWTSVLAHVVGLGAPHLGAPLERFVARGTHRMSRLPETKPIATWLNKRSVGIKDLRYGAILEADWAGFDPDTCLDDRCTEATLLPGVHYAVVSATLSRKPTGWLAHDLLVHPGSAHGIGPTRSIPFESERTLHVGGKTHFHLLNHPDVYAKLRAWLTAANPEAVADAETATDTG